MALTDMHKALLHWPALMPLAENMFKQLENGWRIETPTLCANIVIGDARATVPAWEGHADAWFLDGFSPPKNPELWDADLMNSVYHHTQTGGTFATYSSAGFVRSRLGDAGFNVTRVDGFGRKRHMSVGIKP